MALYQSRWARLSRLGEAAKNAQKAAEKRQQNAATQRQKIAQSSLQRQAKFRNDQKQLPPPNEASSYVRSRPRRESGGLGPLDIGRAAFDQANQRVFEPTELIGGRLSESIGMGQPINAQIDIARRLSRGDIRGAVEQIPRTFPGSAPAEDRRDVVRLPGDIRAAAEAVVGGDAAEARQKERLSQVGMTNRFVGGLAFDPTNLLGAGLAPDVARIGRLGLEGIQERRAASFGVKSLENLGDIRQLTTGAKDAETGGRDLLKWRPRGEGGHIHTVNVPESAQGQGRASALMTKAIQDIKAQTPGRVATADVETPEGASLLSKFGATFEDQYGNPITLEQAKEQANRGAWATIDLTKPSPVTPRATGLLSSEVGGTRVPDDFGQGLSPEADELLDAIDSGAAQPAFISQNLRRLASENGIPVDSSTRPEDIIEAMRARRTSRPRETPPPPPEEPPPMGDDFFEDSELEGMLGDIGAQRRAAAGEPPGFDPDLPGGRPPQEPPPPDIVPPVEEPPHQSGRFPRSSQLKTLGETAQSIRAGTENVAGTGGRLASRIPGARGATSLLNPSAAEPSAGVVREIGQQGARDLQDNLIAYEALGEAQDSISSAIETGIRQADRSVGFKEKDGILYNQSGELGPVGDVMENPSKYRDRLTPEQKSYMDDVIEVLKDGRANEKANGVETSDIFSEEGIYFPRRVTQVRGEEQMRGLVRKGVGSKQGFQQERMYQMMQDAMDNNIEYASDIAGLVGARIRAGQKAIRDKQIADLALKYSAEPSFGTTQTKIAGLGGAEFKPETANIINEALSPHEVEGGLTALNTPNRFMRTLMATGDLSAAGIQITKSIFTRPAAFAKSMAAGIDGLVMDSRGFGRYIDNNKELIEDYTRAGGQVDTNEFAFSDVFTGQKGKAAQGLQKATHRFDQAFQNMQNVNSIEQYKAMVGLGDSDPGLFTKFARILLGDISGKTNKEMAASIANKYSGRTAVRSLGVQGTQRQAEAFLAFAPRYMRALTSIYGDALQGGTRGAEARRALLSFWGGTAATYALAAEALGQDAKLDPRGKRFGGDGAEFLTLKIGNQRVGIGGLDQRLVRTFADAASDPSALDEVSMNNPAVKFARGSTSPALGFGIDVATGEDYLGQPVQSPEEIAKRGVRNIAPFGVSSAITEGVETYPAQFFGGRSFPADDPYGSFAAAFKETSGHDYNAEDPADRQLAKTDTKLKGLQEAYQESSRKRGSEVRLEADKTNEILTQAEQDQGMVRLAESIVRGNGAAAANYKDARADYLSYRAGIFEARYEDTPATSEVGRLTQEYQTLNPKSPEFTDENGEVDWDKYEKEKTLRLKKLPRSTQNAVTTNDKFKDPNLNRVDREFLKAKGIVDKFYDTPKYKELSAEHGDLVDEVVNTLAPAMQTEYLRRTGGEMERSLAIRAILRSETYPPEVESFLKNEYGGSRRSRRSGRAKRKDPANPDRDKILTDNADLISRYYPDLIKQQLTREQEAALPEGAFENIGAR
jgi:hypothetical protein